MGGKVCLRCKGKTLLGDVKKLFILKTLVTKPNNFTPQANYIEDDGIESRLPFKIFSTLRMQNVIHYVKEKLLKPRNKTNIKNVDSRHGIKSGDKLTLGCDCTFFLLLIHRTDGMSNILGGN